MIDPIDRTMELDVSVEEVWRALTEPAELARWFSDAVRDVRVRPGHGGWWEWDSHGRFAVRFEVVRPPRRLVWVWARDPGVAVNEGPSTRVEWTLEGRPDGSTLIRLREEGFVDTEQRARNVEGWGQELAELRRHLATAG